MNEFRTDVGENFLDTVLELEELMDVYLLEEFIENEPIRLMKLEESRKVQLSSNLDEIDWKCCWVELHKIVVGCRQSESAWLMSRVRKAYR